MFSNSIIGIGSSICFLIGYFTPAYIEIDGIMHRIYASLNGDAIGISILIFAAITAGSLVKDIDDYEGDLKNGVKNVFTVYGLKRGIKIVSVPVFLSFLTPLFLIRAIYDFIFLASMGSMAVALFNKMKNSKAVFVMYLIALAYTIFRYFS